MDVGGQRCRAALPPRHHQLARPFAEPSAHGRHRPRSGLPSRPHAQLHLRQHGRRPRAQQHAALPRPRLPDQGPRRDGQRGRRPSGADRGHGPRGASVDRAGPCRAGRSTGRARVGRRFDLHAHAEHGRDDVDGDAQPRQVPVGDGRRHGRPGADPRRALSRRRQRAVDLRQPRLWKGVRELMPALGNHLNFAQYEARNVVVHNGNPNPPSGNVKGQLWFNNSSNELFYWDGTIWQSAKSGAGSSGPPSGPAGGDLTGTYPNPTIAPLKVTDAHVAAANKDGAAGTPSMRTLGTGAGQAMAGNTVVTPPDATTGSKGVVQLAGDLAGTAASPQIAAGVITDAEVAAANKDGAGATPSLRTLGLGAQQAFPGNSRLDMLNPPIVAVGFNNQKASGLADPTVGTDAATKQYVDNVAQGLDAKRSVKAATTTNITLSGTQTVDGVALIANDRVLVKNQPYRPPTASTSWPPGRGRARPTWTTGRKSPRRSCSSSRAPSTPTRAGSRRRSGRHARDHRDRLDAVLRGGHDPRRPRPDQDRHLARRRRRARDHGQRRHRAGRQQRHHQRHDRRRRRQPRRQRRDRHAAAEQGRHQRHHRRCGPDRARRHRLLHLGDTRRRCDDHGHGRHPRTRCRPRKGRPGRRGSHRQRRPGRRLGGCQRGRDRDLRRQCGGQRLPRHGDRLMPELPGSLKPPRLASAPGSPVGGQTYYDTALSKLRWWNDSAWVAAEGGSAGLRMKYEYDWYSGISTPRRRQLSERALVHGRGASSWRRAHPSAGEWAHRHPAMFVDLLPPAPVDGQEIYYQSTAMLATNTIWHLRYNNALSTYKWQYVGGTPMLAFASAGVAYTTGAAYVVGPALAAPKVVLPRGGEYQIEFKLNGQWAGTTPDMRVQLYVGGTATSTGWTGTGVIYGFSVARRAARDRHHGTDLRPADLVLGGRVDADHL